MKKSMAFLFLGLVFQSSMASASTWFGGDVKINNQTPYGIEHVDSYYNQTVREVSTSESISPNSLGNIYVEFEHPGTYRPMGKAEVIFGVSCPDGQLDKFRVIVQFDSPYEKMGHVYLMSVEHDPVCVRLAGNDNIVWQWNQYGGGVNNTITIRSK